MRYPTWRRSRDMTSLLSEVYHADRLANDPRTTAFLEAGERLLRRIFLRDTSNPAEGNARTPFEKVLAFLKRDDIVEEALEGQRMTPKRPSPTLAAFRYRWRSQVGYLRDLVVWALSPRMERPQEIGYASGIIDTVQGGGRLSDAIGEIAATEVQALRDDQAFQLQMIFQAALAHDSQVADALHRIDKAHVGAWTDFLRQSYAKLGLRLREGVSFEELGCALHTAGQGVMFRTTLTPRPGHRDPAPDKLLCLIAMALVFATADQGNGTTGEALDLLIRRHRPTGAAGC